MNASHMCHRESISQGLTSVCVLLTWKMLTAADRVTSFSVQLYGKNFSENNVYFWKKYIISGDASMLGKTIQ